MNIAAPVIAPASPPLPPLFVKMGATYQDVIDAPERMTAEIVGSGLALHPRPNPRHSLASSHLGDELVSPFGKGRGGPGGWWILDEPELHLGAHVLVPDLAGWRRERMPHLPETAAIEIAPDWVCEVISPSTGRLDRGPKRIAYAEQGVRWLWLIDPTQRTLEAFELIQGRWSLIAVLTDDAPVSVAPFDAITFPLGALWA